MSKFGRTQQWQCPQGHGYFQTFVLYLAEKGFVHRMGWADLKRLTGGKRQLFCAGCGAALDDRPHDACPYCQSAVGVIDPARLASAIDVQQAAPTPMLPAEAVQSKCWSCGGVADATQESHCRHCHAILQKVDSARATAATAAVENEVRQNYQQQLPKVSSRKIIDVAAHAMRVEVIANHMDYRQALTKERLIRWLMVVVPTLVLLAWFTVQWQRGTLGTLIPALAEPQAITTPPPVAAATPVPPVPVASQPVPIVQKAPEPQVADGPSFETMFSFPAMECAADAAARSAVKIRQIIVVPVAASTPGVSGVDNRKAYLQLQQARQELANGTPFPVVLEQYGSPGAVNAQPISEFFGRGTGKPEIERAAFCLPVQALSPIFKSAQGFHVIQVVAAR